MTAKGSYEISKFGSPCWKMIGPLNVQLNIHLKNRRRLEDRSGEQALNSLKKTFSIVVSICKVSKSLKKLNFYGGILKENLFIAIGICMHGKDYGGFVCQSNVTMCSNILCMVYRDENLFISLGQRKDHLPNCTKEVNTMALELFGDRFR